MKRYLKKPAAVLMSLALMFSMSATALAAAEGTDSTKPLLGDGLPGAGTEATASAYVVGAANMAASATVTLVVEAGDAFDAETFEVVKNTAFSTTLVLDVTDLDGETGLTVMDVILSANNTGYITFATSEGSKPNFKDIVTYNGHEWTSGTFGYDGWTFCLNDRFPLIPFESGYIGAAINETPIWTGDVIHFYFDLPSQLGEDVSSSYVRGVLSDQQSDTVTVQLQGFKLFIGAGADPDMWVYEYVNLDAGIQTTLVDSNGVTHTATSDADGQVTFTDVAAGTALLTTEQVLLTGLEVYDFLDNWLLKYTGAYCPISVS